MKERTRVNLFPIYIVNWHVCVKVFSWRIKAVSQNIIILEPKLVWCH